MNFFFQSISSSINLSLISECLTLNSNYCFSMLSLNILVKEIFGFQKLKISFSEILFQKNPSQVSLVLLLQLPNREEVICRNEKRVL